MHVCACAECAHVCVYVCMGMVCKQYKITIYNNILFLSFFMYIFADLVKHSMLILVSEM